MVETFTGRMGGTTVEPQDADALFAWLDDLRHVRSHPRASAQSVEQGRALFVAAGCDGCHAGTTYTNNALESVRIDTDPVKTPTLLGVGARASLFHDGCADTLEARFEAPCDAGVGHHGEWGSFTDDELGSLVAYMRTL
jgi:hypothetical protein